MRFVRTIIATAALVAASASPTLAQPDSPNPTITRSQLDSIVTPLLNRITFLESVVGTEKFKSAQIPCNELEQHRPATWFSNGEYDLAFRNRQFGCAFDAVVAATQGLQVQFSGLATRVAAVEGNGENNPTPPNVAGAVTLDAVGNLVLPITSKLCIGPCIAADASIQIAALGAAEILGRGNMALNDPQNATQIHHNVISVAGHDGGLRLIHGAYWHNGVRNWPDTSRPLSIFAFDSFGTASFSQDVNPNSSEPSQALVLMQHRDRGLIGWTSMRGGWKHCVGWSTSINDYANLWCPPSGNTVSRPTR